MVAPAIIAAAKTAAPKVLGALKGGIGAIGSKISNLGGSLKNGLLNTLGGSNLLDGLVNKGVDAGTRAAYTSYLTGIGDDMAQALEARAEKYDQKLQNQFNEAEPQYLEEAYTQLPELQNLINDIATQNTEIQRGNLRRANAVLAQQGVRGGQAGILLNRAMGETSRDAQRDINNLVYNEAANRQNSRLNYFGDKALTPWTTMSSAYGNSMAGANNALSQAQGNVYQNAYTAMLNKRAGSNVIR